MTGGKTSIKLPSGNIPAKFALLLCYYTQGRVVDSFYKEGGYVITCEPPCRYAYLLIVFSRLIGDCRCLRNIYNTKEGLLWLQLLMEWEAAAIEAQKQPQD